jgi:hypothetical protein
VTKPLASALTVTPFAFPAAGRGGSIAVRRTGATVRYRLSEPATTRFTVEAELAGRRLGGRCVRPTRANRNRPRCLRYAPLPGSFSHAGRQGANSFRFTGRLRGRKLIALTYRLVAVPTDAAGNRGAAQRKRFRIVP